MWPRWRGLRRGRRVAQSGDWVLCSGGGGGDPPPLLCWTFQQIAGGGLIHPGATPGPGHRVGGHGLEGRGLREAWRGLRLPSLPGAGWERPGRPPARKGGLLLRCSCSPWGGQCFKSKSLTPPEDRRRCEGRCSLERGRHWGRTGGPDHCLPDSTGVGCRGGQCILHARVTSETQRERRTGGKFT